MCLDRLKGIGVPWGEIKGVLHSEADPNVAAREISHPEDPNAPFVIVPCPMSKSGKLRVNLD